MEKKNVFGYRFVWRDCEFVLFNVKPNNEKNLNEHEHLKQMAKNEQKLKNST